VTLVEPSSAGHFETGQSAGAAGAILGAGHVAAARRLHGELRLPSDKSIAHRALLFNAMAAGSAMVTVNRPGADVRSTAAALRLLGALDGETPAADGATRYSVRGGGDGDAASLPGRGEEELGCGNSGTTVRLISGALAGRGRRGATLTGDASLARRPMERVAAPLREMGAEVITTEGRLPIHVLGQRPLRAMAHRLPVASAQVLGAISLAAMAADGRTTIETPGPTRDHTERLLAWLGASIARDGTLTIIDGPAGLTARDISVPGDISSAAAWLVAGALHPDAAIRLLDVGLNPSRLAVVDVLREMGADIDLVVAASGDGPEPTGELVVRSARRLRAISLSGARIAELIDELPLLAIAMAAADGVSEVRGAAELRVKESDRVALVVRNLRAIGVEADELPDGWRVVGTGAGLGLRGASGVRSRAADPIEIETAGDHRIAISFAVAAATGLSPELTIDDPACIDVSYPGFWDDLASLSAGAAR
jgi:3-phosphoshikimate 1-carboxyvinyltransferase